VQFLSLPVLPHHGLYLMEISKLDATAASVAGRVLRVRDPRHLRGDSDVDKRPFLLSDDADPTSAPCTLTLLGPDSPRVRKLLEPQRARYMQQALLSQSRSKGFSITAEDIAYEEEENLNIAVAATTGWTGFTSEGEPLVFSAEAARTLYESSRDILEQALAFIRERANFLQGSKTK
jgi:hypothetical protein